MPRVNNAYVCPAWADNTPPAIDAAEMLAIGESIVANQNKILSHDQDITDLNELVATLQASLGGAAKIQTGSYVGTGTYGSANPCSLTFDFVPQFVVIFTNASQTGVGETFRLRYKQNKIYTTGDSYGYVLVTWSNNEKTILWYSPGAKASNDSYAAGYQNNVADIEYEYVAIG